MGWREERASASLVERDQEGRKWKWESVDVFSSNNELWRARKKTGTRIEEAGRKSTWGDLYAEEEHLNKKEKIGRVDKNGDKMVKPLKEGGWAGSQKDSQM